MRFGVSSSSIRLQCDVEQSVIINSSHVRVVHCASIVIG